MGTNGTESADNGHVPDCSVVISEVYLYLDLECNENRRFLLQKHLDDCSGCLREYGIEREVKALVARCCGDETAPKELRERLRIKLDQLEIQVETHEYLP
ncbi:mycothiol system anti-sigma-R factor [Micromonosporaceae bacterium Da 78-11]